MADPAVPGTGTEPAEVVPLGGKTASGERFTHVRLLSRVLAAHRIKAIYKDRDEYHRARCHCGWPGSPWDNRAAAQCEFERHVADEILTYEEGAR